MVVYLDDGIGAAQGQLKAEQDALGIQGDLFKAGFVTNLSKCKWSPYLAWLRYRPSARESGCASGKKSILSKHSYPKH